MNEAKLQNKETLEESMRMEAARNFLSGYQLCLEMLNLRQYERKRAPAFEWHESEDILCGNEAYWRARMHEIAALINGMRNGREKVVLYYHYIRGQSIEHAADMLGISRRTGYRVHRKALLSIYYTLERMKRFDGTDLLAE